jgi:hypothetical protein
VGAPGSATFRRANAVSCWSVTVLRCDVAAGVLLGVPKDVAELGVDAAYDGVDATVEAPLDGDTVAIASPPSLSLVFSLPANRESEPEPRQRTTKGKRRGYAPGVTLGIPVFVPVLQDFFQRDA